MVVVRVDEVGRASAVGLVVADALDEPARIQAVATERGEARVGEVGLVDAEDGAADAGYGFEVVGGRKGP